VSLVAELSRTSSHTSGRALGATPEFMLSKSF